MTQENRFRLTRRKLEKVQAKLFQKKICVEHTPEIIFVLHH